jgi:hypothetical protein
MSPKHFYQLSILFFSTGDLDFYLETIALIFSKNQYRYFRQIFSI